MQKNEAHALVHVPTMALQARKVAGNAEQRLIGSLMINPDALAIQETRLIAKPDHFAVELWREAYRAILELTDEGRRVTAEYLSPLVASRCEIDIDQVHYDFIAAMESVSIVSLTFDYALSVVRQWQSRELRTLAMSVISEVENPAIPTDEVIANLIKRTETVRDGVFDREPAEFNMQATVQDFVNQPDAEVIPTGLDVLDNGVRGGFRRGQFIVVGARPSVGKSALCGQIALNMAIRGTPVMYLSFEMSANEMTARWLNQSEYNIGIEHEREMFGQMPLRAIESAGWSIDRVESEARLAVRRHGMSCIAVDYLGLIRPSDTRANRVEQISDITRRLKQLAATLDIVVLSAHQFNRAKEGREIARPKMSDFRDSGSIEQDADILIGLHRDLTPGNQSTAMLYVMKQRSGETSDIDLTFNGERTLFCEPVFMD